MTIIHAPRPVPAQTDQAALYGVLARIEALGLELLEVRRESPGGVTPAHPDGRQAEPS
jgi:hypothetical protein